MVKAKETNLEGVLEGKKQYQVPLYQRTFSWGKRQIDQLWSDILEVAELRRTEPTATHFIGSLVLAASPDNGAVGLQKFLVVDGQQRLTTLTLLLAALRDHQAEVDGEEHRDRVNTQYLLNRYERGQPPKVWPTQGDRAAYTAVMLATATAGGEDLVGEAYRSFRSKIAAADDPNDPADIAAIENTVLRGLGLVAVTAEAGDNAHRIFESLNNTGLKLTQADLIKNFLFMRLADRADTVYASLWRPLEEKLDPESLELLFWLDLVQTDEKATQADTYLGQQKRLEKFTSPSAMEAEIGRIAGFGELLALILNPSREKHTAVRERLLRIKDWGSTTAYPVVIQILARRAAGQASDDQVARALLYLESYFVRRIVIGRATAGLNRTLLQAAAVVSEADEIDTALRRYLSAGRRHFGTDRQVREAADTIAFYWQGRAAQKKLILLWLEQSFRPKELIDPAGLTIEHVLPQSLNDESRAEFGEDLDAEAVILEHERLVHTLGNLTLSGYNSELSNSPFSVKRLKLSQSGLSLNQAIADHEKWRAEEILSRGAALADRIVDLWPGPDETVVGPTDRVAEARATIAALVAEIPAGRWTTYSEVAIVAGLAPVAVGTTLSSYPIPNAWRVLQVGGTISPSFRWPDPARREDPRALLQAEGVHFDDAGRAVAGAFLEAEHLAALAGYDVSAEDIDGRRRSSRGEGGLTLLGTQQVAFWERLREWGQAHSEHITRWPAPRPKHWFPLSLGGGAAVELKVNSEDGWVTAEVYIYSDKPLFQWFFDRRAEIENELGFQLEWRPMPEYKASRILVTKPGDFRDPASQQPLIEWLVEAADALTDVFSQELAAVRG